jgi:prepilin-type processing-associated H-X9-DG protein
MARVKNVSRLEIDETVSGFNVSFVSGSAFESLMVVNQASGASLNRAGTMENLAFDRRAIVNLSANTNATAGAHANKTIFVSAATSAALVLDRNFSNGDGMVVIQTAAGRVNFIAGSGATVVKPSAKSSAATTERYAQATLFFRSNVWYLDGNVG